MKDWFFFLGFILLGTLWKGDPGILDALNLLVLGFFLLSYAYSLNDYFDGDSKKRVFILPLLLSLVSLLFFDFWVVALSVSFILVFTLYSAPPRLKKYPLIGTLLNPLGFVLLFYIPLGEITKEAIFFGVYLGLCVLYGQLFQELLHIKRDRGDRLITTSIFFGKDVSQSAMKICLVLAPLFAFLSGYPVVAIVSTINWVFINKKISGDSRKKFRISMIMIGLLLAAIIYSKQISTILF